MTTPEEWGRLSYRPGEIVPMTATELRAHNQDARQRAVVVREVHRRQWLLDAEFFWGATTFTPPPGKPLDAYGLELAKWGAW